MEFFRYKSEEIEAILLSQVLDHSLKRLLPAVHLYDLYPVENLIQQVDPLVALVRSGASQVIEPLAEHTLHGQRNEYDDQTGEHAPVHHINEHADHDEQLDGRNEHVWTE